eukprot:GHVL01032647.1.p1 GENE.GHVL01032647.1~~GHVL01032647.1.p1  ORF type:complete len:237 (+),score=33.00 GHVL01032647.1:61-711(+)
MGCISSTDAKRSKIFKIKTRSKKTLTISTNGTPTANPSNDILHKNEKSSENDDFLLPDDPSPIIYNIPIVWDDRTESDEGVNGDEMLCKSFYNISNSERPDSLSSNRDASLVYCCSDSSFHASDSFFDIDLNSSVGNYEFDDINEERYSIDMTASPKPTMRPHGIYSAPIDYQNSLQKKVKIDTTNIRTMSFFQVSALKRFTTYVLYQCSAYSDMI